MSGKPVSVALMVGPEGGFTEEEVDAAHRGQARSRSAWARVSCGRRPLRLWPPR